MSESSELSEAPSDQYEDIPPRIVTQPKPKSIKLKQGTLSFAGARNAPRQKTPESPARDPTPPHDDVLADNPDVAFIVMFRHRFNEAFPKHVPNLGPQDIEQGVVESPPSERVEYLLCGLLGLCLNRVKDVERGHYSRALEEAISTNRHQWPLVWNGANPLPGQRSFADLSPEGKLTLLRALVLWSLNSSNAIKDNLAVSYKQSRREDDKNQPLSVQPWGDDKYGRRYWLIEGQDDTSFRIYKQRHPRDDSETWWSVAGSLDELQTVADNLRIEDSGLSNRRLADRIETAIPRLEAAEEKRKRKEYRLSRKTAFARPEPGFSLYEGRTRGKRMKYTFSDEEDGGSDAAGHRGSTRVSDRSTPVDPAAPTMTSSGRQVRSRFGRSYGDPVMAHEGGRAGSLDPSQPGRRTRGQANGTSRLGQGASSADHTSDEEDDIPSGEDWGGNDEDFDERHEKDEDEEMTDNDSDDSIMKGRPSLVVTLRYRKVHTGQQPNGLSRPGQQYSQQNGGPTQFAPLIRDASDPATVMGGSYVKVASPLEERPSSKNSATPQTHAKSSASSPARPMSSSSAGRQTPTFKPDPYGPWNPYQQQPTYYGGQQHGASWQPAHQHPGGHYQPPAAPLQHPHATHQSSVPHHHYSLHAPFTPAQQQQQQPLPPPPPPPPQGSPHHQQSPYVPPHSHSPYGQGQSQPGWGVAPLVYAPRGSPPAGWQPPQQYHGPPMPQPGALQPHPGALYPSSQSAAARSPQSG